MLCATRSGNQTYRAADSLAKYQTHSYPVDRRTVVELSLTTGYATSGNSRTFPGTSNIMRLVINCDCEEGWTPSTRVVVCNALTKFDVMRTVYSVNART
ncbi:unnamed protein product [Peronospora belbahrii]|uniref:Uncharacterized protein n=1 Tax=Peronospora belbahrii TaxID=622444 RepID=A0AAU9KP02_9STRA|nr:unnamed protein product [Peronospora belbahrii]